MFVNDNLKVASLTIANVAGGGNIGAGAATVDIASTFLVNQTTAGQTLTLPNPTDALASDRVQVLNVGSTAFTMYGTLIPAGSFSHFAWSGTAWVADSNAGRNMGASVLVAAVPAGAFTVAHNLGMAAADFSKLIYRAYNSTGNEVVFRRNKAADTATAMGFNSSVALTNITFDIISLA